MSRLHLLDKCLGLIQMRLYPHEDKNNCSGLKEKQSLNSFYKTRCRYLDLNPKTVLFVPY